MVEERKIFYLDDMDACHEQMALLIYGFSKKYQDYEIELHSRKTPLSGIRRAERKNIGKYSIAVFDINLENRPDLDGLEKTAQGLYVIEAFRTRKEDLNLKKPILVGISSKNHGAEARQFGADRFFFKKDFFGEEGSNFLEECLCNGKKK